MLGSFLDDGSPVAFQPGPVGALSAAVAADFVALATSISNAPAALLALHGEKRPSPFVGIGLDHEQALTLATVIEHRLRDDCGSGRSFDLANDSEFATHIPQLSGFPSLHVAGMTIVSDAGEILGTLSVLGFAETPAAAALFRQLAMLAQGIADCIASDQAPEATGSRAAPSSIHNRSARQMTAAIDASRAAVIEMTLDGTITSWNCGAEHLYQYRGDEIIGSSIRRLVPRSRWPEDERISAKVKSGQSVSSSETVHIARDGRGIRVVISVSPILDDKGRVIGASMIVHDISHLVLREREARRLARLYATLSSVNRAIADRETRLDLLHQVCQIVVHEGGFTLAWIGWHDPVQNRIIPIAIGGAPADYAQSVLVSSEENDLGLGPTGRAFRSGRTQVCNDLYSDAAMQPWLQHLKAARLRSSIAIPIIQERKIQGTLNVYSQHSESFLQTEVTLLEDVARSTGFALERIAREEVARATEHTLIRERGFSDSLIESTPGILCLCDPQLHNLRWNTNLQAITGYSAGELEHMRVLDLIAPRDRPAMQATIDAVLAHGKGEGTARLQAKDGTTRPYFLSAHRTRLGEQDCILGIGIDISSRISAEHARRKSDDRYQQLFQCSPAGIVIVDRAGVYLDANPGACQLFGYPREELVGMRVLDVVTPSDRDRVEGTIASILAGDLHEGDWTYDRKDGGKVSASAVAAPMGDGNIMVVLSDITVRKAQERRIARLDRTRLMIGAIHSVMLRGTARGELLRDACRSTVVHGAFAVAAVVDLDPYTNQARLVCVEHAPDTGLTDDDASALVASNGRLSLRAMRTGRPRVASDPSLPATVTAAGESHSPGANIVRSTAAFPLWIAGQARHALILMATDTGLFDTEAIDLLEWMAGDLSFALDHLETAQRLRQATHFDPLTGLLNAQGTREQIAKLSATALEQQSRLCICAIDLEDFSLLNDRFGREGGDQLLRAVGERLQRLTHEGCIVGRIGGDTFALVGLQDDGDCGKFAKNHLLAAFHDPFDLGGHPIQIAIHAGIAIYPVREDDYDTQVDLDHAVRAMQNARVRGEPIAFYSTNDEQTRSRSLSLESQLHAAIENNEFVLAYQPRLDIVSGEIVGAEALVRWQHPQQGLLPPADFIELAERSGLIRPLGTRIIQMVCTQQRAWHTSGVPIVPVAANVSGIQVNRDDLPRIVRQALADHALEPEWLELELTESAIMHDVVRSTKLLTELRDAGIRLSLDDFGTGYSSLSYLKRLPFNRVKIDRSFITDVTRSVEDATIALAIIAIARSLKLTSVAEGVETGAQLNFLAKNHCDEMQGFYFSPPVDPDTFASFLREHRKLAALPTETTENRSVLVVDDEQSICRALTRLLRRDGYRILTANSGEKALDLLALHRVQVIISDQRMPGMTGTEFLDKVKSLYPDTIRVILSGYTDLNVITESVNRGAVFRFLTKPWNDDDLRAQIRDAFIQHQRQNAMPPDPNPSLG